MLSTQRAAQASLEWFENLGQYVHQDPTQFAFNIMTRSRRVTYDNLARARPGVRRALRGVVRRRTASVGPARTHPPMFQPVTLRAATGPGLTLHNRVIVSPMDMYVAEDGVPTEFHLVHLGGKALGGAGLVMTEMICTVRRGPDHARLRRPVDRRAARRAGRASSTSCTRSTSAAIGCQLGHSGAKGSTKLMWEGMDEPLPSGNWAGRRGLAGPLLAATTRRRSSSTAPGSTRSATSSSASARRAAEAGFDLLELHCAHGYLLSGFLSPVTNRRTDEYGGDVAGRLRFPLEVWHAMREVWPADRPMTVRISATDWVEDGQSLEDALAVAAAFAEAGAAAIDVSTGQVTKAERPAFGRSYQTPYADAIRNRLGVPDDRGRRDLVVRRRELDPDGRPRRPVRARPGAPLRPDVDAARRRRAGLRRAGRGLADAVAGRAAQAADRSLGRAEAAARADPVRRDGDVAPALAHPTARTSGQGRTTSPIPPGGQPGHLQRLKPSGPLDRH